MFEEDLILGDERKEDFSQDDQPTEYGRVLFYLFYIKQIQDVTGEFEPRRVLC